MLRTGRMSPNDNGTIFPCLWYSEGTLISEAAIAAVIPLEYLQLLRKEVFRSCGERKTVTSWFYHVINALSFSRRNE